ncbi:N-acetylgalactosamine kinase [Phlebotomus argentipes]|uniref:N-acetylgalactosamine kinase n=1 Tax=Phlebotomus argentipes TaxID=94469 RepID=UPI002892E83F|nr:N-acetylgalactosamine kinase [Phlebotomus argentipes]
MSDEGAFVPVREAIGSEEALNLKSFFANEFNREPQFYVRVPGRVNIIGEHIDYCGYPVLPMAIEKNIILAVATTEDGILQLKNAQNVLYKPFKCSIDSFKIEQSEGKRPEWYNYFLCGVRGALEEILASGGQPKGLMVAVSGSIPPASGLSSSSALVSAACLATMHANGQPLQKQLLATISATSERHIGTQGGGMDQAISFLARPGCAQFIEWNPLTATPVNLPPQALFLIANSLTEANKAATSDFNQRVVECRLGCRLLAKMSGRTDWREVLQFAHLQKLLGYSLDEMESLAEECLSREVYSRADLLAEFQVDATEFEECLLTPNTRSSQLFRLRQRALHVFQEANRVMKFRQAAQLGDIDSLGELMRASHESLRVQYECSHQNLNDLVAATARAGASGRLTGAGWGGCIVALCHSIDQCDGAMQELRKYFAQRAEAEGRRFEDLVFITNPQRGAEVFLN